MNERDHVTSSGRRGRPGRSDGEKPTFWEVRTNGLLLVAFGRARCEENRANVLDKEGRGVAQLTSGVGPIRWRC
jgi:hypothetical protein